MMLGSSQKRPVTRSSVPNVHSPSLGPSGSPEGDAPLSSPRRESKVNSSLGLPSPREYRHGSSTRRASTGSASVSMLETQTKASCLSVFQCAEVKELLAVGDKVWTADRRTPKIAIRSVETGDIEKELRPPNTQDPDEKNKTKEHIFPWSMIHVRFPIVTVLQPDDSDSESESPCGSPASQSPRLFPSAAPSEASNASFGGLQRYGSINAGHSIRNLNASRRPSLPTSSSRRNLKQGTTPKGSSGRRPPPQKNSAPEEPMKKELISYVDEVWVGYSNGTIRVFNAITGAFITDMREAGGIYTMLQWGDCVYSGSNDWTIRKWDANKKLVIGQFLPGESGHSNSVRSLIIADKCLASASDDFTIRLWDHALVGMDAFSTTGRCLRVMRKHSASVTTLCWVEKRLWSGSEDATVMVWDIETGSVLKTFKDTRHVVTRLVALPKIHRVMCCSVDNVVRVYDARTVDLVSELEGHTGFVHSCAAIATELRYVVWSSSQDATLRVWSVAGDGNPESTSKFCKDMDDADEAHWLRWKLMEGEAKQDALRRELDELRAKVLAANDESAANLKNLRQLEHENNEQADELVQLRTRVSELEDELNTLRARDSDNTQLINSLNSELADKNSENMQLTHRLHDLERTGSSLQSQTKDHIDQMSALRKRIQLLENELDGCRGERDEALEKVAQLERDLDAANRKLMDSARRKSEDSAQMQRAIDTLDEQLQTALTERDRARDDADRLQKMVNDMGRVIKDLQHDFGDAKSLSNLEKDTREAIRVERDLLGREVDRQALEVAELKESRSRLATQCASLDSLLGLAQMRASMLEARSLIADAADALHRDAKSKVSDLRAALAAKAAEAAKVPHLQSQLSDKDSQISALENELTGCKNRLMSAEHELAELRRAIEDNVSLRRNNSDLENALRLSNLERDRASNELDQLKSKYETLKNAHDILADRFNARDEENRRLGRVEDQLKFLEDELLRVKGELATALTDIERLTREKADLEQNDDRSAREALDKESENRRLRQELDALKQAVDELMRERDALQADKTTWGDRMKAIQKEIENREARVARTEEVLSGMRAEATEMEDLIRQLREREKELAAELASLQNERIKNADLENTIAQLQAEHNADSEHYAFILRSRTDFIQAVYDWLLCSAMSRRCAKKSDLTVAGAMDALVSAVEGAYKRGHYILSNYVSELEKHHLGVSPTLYPPDPVLQQMFKSQRQECEKFIKAYPAKSNLPAVTRLGIVLEDNKGLSQTMSKLAMTQSLSPKRSNSRERPKARSFTPPAAYRKASMLERKSGNTGSHSPPLRPSSSGSMTPRGSRRKSTGVTPLVRGGGGSSGGAEGWTIVGGTPIEKGSVPRMFSNGTENSPPRLGDSIGRISSNFPASPGVSNLSFGDNSYGSHGSIPSPTIGVTASNPVVRRPRMKSASAASRKK
ncbi:Myosin heavy chain kinase B [Diplonema papillatum]|nr:Myosin heavy chain kinase B [Diplonema papillatum]KAJ9452993.1 Myosin heavy chain kinase B [Diplonema papillatum]